MNILQTLGLVGLIGGAFTGFLRMSNMPLPKWSVGGGTLMVILPPDWVIGALLIGGLVLMVLGTAWKVVRGEDHGESEDEGMVDPRNG